jgi:hypothetical protein
VRRKSQLQLLMPTRDSITWRITFMTRRLTILLAINSQWNFILKFLIRRFSILKFSDATGNFQHTHKIYLISTSLMLFAFVLFFV